MSTKLELPVDVKAALYELARIVNMAHHHARDPHVASGDAELLRGVVAAYFGLLGALTDDRTDMDGVFRTPLGVHAWIVESDKDPSYKL